MKPRFTVRFSGASLPATQARLSLRVQLLSVMLFVPPLNEKGAAPVTMGLVTGYDAIVYELSPPLEEVRTAGVSK
ncbi:hypothetical protein D9M70_451020 [compost metagenome]